MKMMNDENSAATSNILPAASTYDSQELRHQLHMHTHHV